MKTLPFKALLPYDNRILILDYAPFIPVCYEEVINDQTSDSDSDSGS